MSEASIDSLPMLVLEHIFHFLRPYRSLDSARCVNSQWRNIVDDCVRHMKRRYSACNHLTWHSINEKLYNESFSAYISERGGHAACYSRFDNCMYMFGGCTAQYSPLADMWRLNMESLEWQRIIQQGNIPSARSLCTLLDCGNLLVLHGGYAKSSNNPINQDVHFFGDLRFFLKNEQRWLDASTISTPILASHGAVILQNRYMVVYGGSTGQDFNADVYVCDLVAQVWFSVFCLGEPPIPRHGHCQIALDNQNILIIGGASVIRGINDDVYLLTFENGVRQATWTKIKINNEEYWPPHVWGVRGCQVGKNVIFLSRPHYVERPALTSTPSIASSSSGSQSRLASPDSLQDRRAVAAAFSSARQSHGLTASAALRRKAQFLTSKSLDEENNDHATLSSNGLLNVSPQNPPSSSQHPRGIELQRACSIPAIIVGEIPKLVVTDDLSGKSNQRNSFSPQNDSTEKTDKPTDHSRSYSSNSISIDESDMYNKLCVFSLDTSKVLTDHEVTWRQQRVEANAPPLLMLYSIVEAKGELVVFGGMKDPATVSNPFLQANSLNEPGAATNQTYILKPDYFQI